MPNVRFEEREMQNLLNRVHTTTKKKKVNSKLHQLFIAVMAVIFVGIMTFNVLLMYDIAAQQTEEIGRMRLQNIASGLQMSLTRAEFTLARISSHIEEMVQSGKSEEEIRSFMTEQRDIEYNLSDGVCMNVFCLVDGVLMVSDMTTPDDFVLQDRSWYRGLMTVGKGNVYITPTYEDAFTGNMCFTIAIMLDDGSMVGLDYGVAEIQAYINEMGSDEYGDAMIVDAKEVIVGYTDPDMIGKRLSSELPQYRDVFLRAVASDEENLSLRTSTNGEDSTIFCSRTGNGWYMMCSVSNSELYRESYRQIVRNSLVMLLLILVIVSIYFVGVRGQRPAERVQNRKEHSAKDQEKSRKTDLTIRDQRKYQFGITSIFIVTMIVAIFGTATMTINESRLKMEDELKEYHLEVADWVQEQKSILEMFEHMVVADPEMVLDYDRMVKFLDDITKYYPKISATYITNPDFPHGHTVIMNNGWNPDEDFVLEERIWYTGALMAEDFYITEPYYDARTGGYCVTLSKVVQSNSGEFYGIFGIDFYLDVLTDILGESYSEQGYAFLVDKNGLIIEHPNLEYELSDVNSVNVHDLVYDKLYSETGMVRIRDYDNDYRVCASMEESVSGFRIIVVKSWWSIYGNVLQYAILFLALFGACILAVNVVMNKMIQWQTKANESLKEAAEAAIQAEQAKSRFLSNMSHEIRTPINAVLGMNEMILREYKDEQLISYAENIQSSGKTLLFLINDILDMSKIESGKMEIVPTEYEMADIITDLWNVICLRAQEKSLTIDFILDETLPRTLFGDEVRIKQIVTNLLTNAVKYTPKGGVELHAAYRKTGEDKIDLIISVKDTGIGIRQEDMGKLFESFRRLDEETNRHIEGTGLGMNITMSLLELMGGDMKVESEYQKGSTFTVTIPQKVLKFEPTGDFEAVLGRHRSGTVQKKESFEAPDANVLVVDDNDMNLAVFTALLKRTKMNIVTADSGRNCLELVKKEPFHLIFMDHMMPEMDGIEALHEIQKLIDFPNEKTPVIALTANALSGAREFYLKEGFADFLTKPIDADLLEQMLLSYLPKELVQIKESTDDFQEERQVAAGQNDTQGFVSENDPGKEKLTRLKEMGFHTGAGLQYCRGDNEFYEGVLVKFAKDAERKRTDIEASFQKDDVNNYQILVHALKSSSKMIGADSLSEMARKAEEAAKNRDIAYIKENHEGLIGKYREMAQNISDVFCFDKEDSPEETSATGTEVSRDELLRRLSELKNSLDVFEVNTAESLFEEMCELVYRGTAVSVLLRDVMQDVDDFELAAAAGKVNELIVSIEGDGA